MVHPMISRKKRTVRIVFRTIALLVFIGLCTLVVKEGYHRYFCTVYPLKYHTEVTAAGEQYNMEPSLIYAVIYTESKFQPNAVSSANAKGLMQLTDDTFTWALSRAGETGKYTADALFEPAVNIHYGVYVLTLLGEQFENTETILAAYNAGQGNVSKWLADRQYSDDGKTLHTIPYPETANYVTRVLDTQKRYKELYSIQ